MPGPPAVLVRVHRRALLHRRVAGADAHLQPAAQGRRAAAGLPDAVLAAPRDPRRRALRARARAPAYQLWHISYGISVMAYQLWRISYGVLVMAY